MPDGVRMDVLLHRLRLTRSRNEAKAACEVGAVTVNGTAVRPSHSVLPGQRVAIRFPRRILEFELLDSPGKSVSKSGAKALYRVLRDESSDT